MKIGVYCAFLLAWATHAQVAQLGFVATPSLSSTPVNAAESARSTPAVQVGQASWYGEDHRGRLMANGQPFDPDKLTAASWFYTHGTPVLVTLKTDPNVLNPQPSRTVLFTITDRGPHRRLVRDGRVIDLSHAVFRRLADPGLGLIEVVVRPEETPGQIASMRPPG
jgi:rare lipoprotein A